jgi:predicted O-linked N-acetylglucosamine transferase (SPINDLY family)
LQQALAVAHAHYQAGELAQAEQLYRRIVDSDPRHAEALHMLAVLALSGGYVDQAEGLLRRSIGEAPRRAEAHLTLGNVFLARGDLLEAEKAYRTAIKRRPGYAEAMSNLASLFNRQHRLGEAIEWARRAAAIKPDYPESFNTLGTALVRQGFAHEGVEAYRAGTAVAPAGSHLWLHLLIALHYLPDFSPDDLFALHVRIGRELSEGLPPAADFSNRRDPERRLRVGYLSADFRQHSVAHFILPVLRSHERSVVEVFCYSDVVSPDAITERAQSLVDAWRPTSGLSDESLARAIREDGIDVLVDLSGHMFNRLGVFARRAAPVQVTYLGYPNTTGLPAMDYRLTDSFADPAGEADARATEKLLRLDPCAWCYEPVEVGPQVAPAKTGPITFCSFNVLAKASAPAMETWARILLQVPGSRLSVKTISLDDPTARQGFVREMQRLGVEPSRLELRGFLAEARAHLAAYAEVDIALDPFPYNGTTTTCEALWMGVPVVALAGRAHVGRVGVSLLNAVGLAELVASDHDDYVRIAVALANDRRRLAELRAGLRERMLASPLMDAAGFCRRLEAAYREMWHGWCSQARL